MTFLSTGLILGIWNAIASAALGWSPIVIGPQLSGVVAPIAPTPIAWKTVIDGSQQESIARRAAEGLAWRAALIRVNNEIAYSVFRQTNAPVLIGHGDVLYESLYLNEYCSRDLVAFESVARAWVDKLRRMQAVFEAHGQLFIYVITPSKAAVYPEYFAGLIDCKASRVQRENLLPLYRGLLDAARINYIDGASMTAALRRETGATDLFARGATHWSMYAAAPVAREVLERIRARFPDRHIGALQWTTSQGNWAWGADADLSWMLNLLVPRLHYPVYDVQFSAASDERCEPIPVAAVADSFFHMLGTAIGSANCVKVNFFYYFSMVFYGHSGLPEQPVRSEEYGLLATSPVVLLEENEQVVARSHHGPALYGWVEANLGERAPKAAQDAPDSIFCDGHCDGLRGNTD